MKTVILTLFLFLGLNAASAMADEYVRGYVRHSDGQYVMPYHRTNPDSNVYNNYNAGYVPNPYKPVEIHSAPTYGEVIHVPQLNPYTGQIE